jgi:hypothetical protein
LEKRNATQLTKKKEYEVRRKAMTNAYTYTLDTSKEQRYGEEVRDWCNPDGT